MKKILLLAILAACGGHKSSGPTEPSGPSVMGVEDKGDPTDRSGAMIPPEKIDKMVEAYRKRRIAQNAATNAGTAAKDAQRLANRLAWENAATIGAVDRARLYKQRIGVADDRERPEHVAINDQVRHFDEPYSNGEMVSGDQSYNCRCVDRFFVKAA